MKNVIIKKSKHDRDEEIGKDPRVGALENIQKALEEVALKDEKNIFEKMKKSSSPMGMSELPKIEIESEKEDNEESAEDEKREGPHLEIVIEGEEPEENEAEHENGKEEEDEEEEGKKPVGFEIIKRRVMMAKKR